MGQHTASRDIAPTQSESALGTDEIETAKIVALA